MGCHWTEHVTAEQMRLYEKVTEDIFRCGIGSIGLQMTPINP